MDILSSLDYWFWTPVVLWALLFLWFYRVSYPLYLKKLVKAGKKWAYVPAVKPVHKLLDLFFTLIASLFSAAPAIWVLKNWTELDPLYGFAVSPLFLILGVILCGIAKKKAARLFQDAYFLEYRRVRYESEIKGKFQSESDVHNRTIWSFTKNLKKAESRGRLWKLVNAMAKTKKIPPDVYAETMYV